MLTLLQCTMVGAGLCLGFLYMPRYPQALETVPASGPPAARSSPLLNDVPAAQAVASLQALRVALAERNLLQQPAAVRSRCAGLAKGLARADMYPALGLILAHPSPYVRLHLTGELFARWAFLDREGALAAALSVMSPQPKARAVNRVLEAWAKNDEPAAWTWVTQLDDAVLQKQAVDLLLARCVVKDPARYAEWAAALDDPFLRRQSLERIAAEWAKFDTSAALAWAQDQTEPNTRRALLRKALEALGKVDPALAFNTAATDPDAAVRHAELANLLATQSARDPAPVLAWIAQTSPTGEMQQPLNQAGKALANAGIVKLQATAAQLPEGPLRDAFRSGAAEAIANDGDPLGAWQMLQNVDASTERSSALWHIGAAFAKSANATQGVLWLQAMPASAERDTAIAGYASILIATKPPVALEWLLQMQQAEHRALALDQNFATWKQADTGRAMAWLWATTKLSADEKQRLAR